MKTTTAPSSTLSHNIATDSSLSDDPDLDALLSELDTTETEVDEAALAELNDELEADLP